MHWLSTIVAAVITAAIGALAVGFGSFGYVVLFRSQEAAASVVYGVGNGILAGIVGFVIGAIALQLMPLGSYLKWMGLGVVVVGVLVALGAVILNRGH